MVKFHIISKNDLYVKRVVFLQHLKIKKITPIFRQRNNHLQKDTHRSPLKPVCKADCSHICKDPCNSSQKCSQDTQVHLKFPKQKRV